jgi:hypothetical protein
MAHAEIDEAIQPQLRYAHIGATSEPTRTAAKVDLNLLADEISGLMLVYCDAIEACKVVPRFSITRLLTIYFKIIGWGVCFDLCLVLGPVDLVLYLLRRRFGRPQLVLGRAIYGFVMRPLQSAWHGEIPQFAVFRVRYLARLLLFYRAQYNINALHKVFNRRQLDLLSARSPDETELKEAEKFQKSFDLFQKITADSYQIGALAIGGPFVLLFTFAVQSGFSFLRTKIQLPAWDLGTFATYGVIFGAVTIWIFVSAWMDMRSVLVRLDVPKMECQVYTVAGLRKGHQIPFDLLFYNVAFASLCIWIAVSRSVDKTDVATYEILAGGLLSFGLVAFARRLWLSRKSVHTLAANIPARNFP